LRLVSDARQAIADGTFLSYKNSFIKRYLKQS
jgi:queuine/archaeosine tRNA-ribosyltransferase